MTQAQQDTHNAGNTRSTPSLKLGIEGFEYADLHDPNRLGDLLAVFEREAEANHPELYAEFKAYRESQGADLSPEQISDLLVRMAPLVGDFVSRLFNITEVRAEQAAAIRREVDTIYGFKNEVIAKAKSGVKKENADDWDLTAIERAVGSLARLLGENPDDPEFQTASAGMRLKRAAEAPESEDAQTLLQILGEDDKAAELFADALAQEPADALAEVLKTLQRWCVLAGRCATRRGLRLVQLQDTSEDRFQRSRAP